MSHKERDGKLMATLAFFINLLLVYIPKDVWRYLTLKAKDVRGKTVVITGGASGIGQRMAEIFALDKGANVVILDLDVVKGQEVVRQITERNGNAIALHCDVTSVEILKNCRDEIEKTFGRVDIVICNAAILYFAHTMELRDEQLQRAFDINVIGVLNTIRTFLPEMELRNDGHIVCMSSICGFFGETYGMAYCPTKFAVRGVMESLRYEFLDRGLDGIRCTTLFPFFVRTPMILNMGMRPTSRFIPFMSVNRCATAAVEAILNEEVQRFIPGYISIMAMAKNIMGHHFTIQGRRFLHCRYVPTAVTPTTTCQGQSEPSSCSSESSSSIEEDWSVTPKRPLKPQPEENDYFEGPYPVGTVITILALSAILLLAGWPVLVEQLAPGTAGHALRLLAERHAGHLLALVGFVFGVHVLEATHALYVCHQLDTTQVCAFKWFAQTVVVGYPSLRRLRDHLKLVRASAAVLKP